MLIMIMMVIGDGAMLPNVVAEYKALLHLFVALGLRRTLQRKYLNICIFEHISKSEYLKTFFLLIYALTFNLFGYIVLLASPLRPVRGSRPSDGGETPKVSDILFGLVQCDLVDSCSIIGLGLKRS